jgi:serine/threonine protein kinase
LSGLKTFFAHAAFCFQRTVIANTTPCLDDYDVLRTLGTGANATVYLVRERHTSHLYALKAIEKYNASGAKVSSSTVTNEQAILSGLNGSDFILPLHACFHDTENFYLVTVRALFVTPIAQLNTT